MANSWVLLLSLLFITTCLNANENDILKCMKIHSNSNSIHTQKSSSYFGLLQSAQQNLRWSHSISTRPLLIFTPSNQTEIQAAVLCAKNHGVQIRVKSGGHDYEGLSFQSHTPFLMIDLVNFKSISIDLTHETAWVQTGATLGELYYTIASKTATHGFPGGTCPSVGVGGHISGGGIGILLRKYGIAADNVVDAKIIDAEGRILDRETMGEDLFWAIRGGGGGSFGVILAWKIKLVRVPEVVSVFNVQREMDRKGLKLIHRWQEVAPKLPQELFVRIIVMNDEKNNSGKVVSYYESMFMGRKHDLLDITSKKFPELGLKDEDVIETSYVESQVFFEYFKKLPKEVLLNRTIQYKTSLKGKSDLVEKPIPIRAFKGMCKRVLKEKQVYIVIEPFGGKMKEISEKATPFPYRKDCLYSIQYIIKWEKDIERKKKLDWMNAMYGFMMGYVSNSPIRRAYINYRDLDIRMNNRQGNTSYLEARIWGEKYFGKNFNKLAQVKAKVDPTNFFTSDQSVVPLY